MEEDLRAHIADDQGVKALVGAHIQWAARDEAPSIALHLIDTDPGWALKGATGMDQARVQIDCWAETFLGAKAIGTAVRAALPAIGAVVGATRFLSCVVIDTDRGRFGESPNLLHRTRIDVRVSFKPA
ncbi:tail completion protein gp17 [Brevundimonas sp.]